jgi:putative ATP-dependent endonuclease of OLD family
VEVVEPEGEPDADAQATAEPEIVQIHIEATITDLSDEQRAHFRDYIEWWNTQDSSFYTTPAVEGVDADSVVEVLRVAFIGEDMIDEDDFDGRTYFARSLEESDNLCRKLTSFGAQTPMGKRLVVEVGESPMK